MGISKQAFLVLLVNGCLSAVVDREPRSLTDNGDGQTDAETRAFPPQGFLMNIRVFYDKSFSSKFDGQADARIIGSFAKVKKIFADQSLGTTIQLDIVGIDKIDGVWESTGENLTKFSHHVNSTLQDANAYVMFVYGPLDHARGWAYFNGTCLGKYYRTSIVDYVGNDTYTSEGVKRVLAYNLGLGDDFPRNKTEKFASDGTNCSKVGGYMDSFPIPARKWSKCSVEEFAKYYRIHQPFCLKSKPSM